MQDRGPDAAYLAFQEALAGQYSLDCELGRGGMGIVYLARDVRLDRPVALKLLPAALARQPALRQRFLREARTAAKLSHPNIVPIFTVDEVQGFVFFSMAYVAGETLGHRVRERGPLSPSDAARLLKEVGWALGYAHGQGVVHRDVKPDNILLEDGSGRAMITDFGIAGLMQENVGTGAGEIIGTAEFMSPEQASGRLVDARSDIYALGVVGYYALSGRLPHQAESVADTLTLIRQRPAARLASVTHGVPSKLCRVIDKCMSQQAGDRYASGGHVAEAVDAVIGARRDVPVPVRMFVNDPIDLPGDGPVYFGLATTVGLFLVWAFEPWATTWTPIVVFGSLGITAPLYLVARRVRRLLASGHTVADVEIAIRKQVEEKHEELVYVFGAEPDRVHIAARRVAYGALGALGATTATIVFASPLAAGGVESLVVASFLGASAVSVGASMWARYRTKDRTDEKGERRLRFWKSRVGHWFFKLCGLGLKKRATAVGATHRPTELQIGLAAEALFSALSKPVRASLGDVPATVRRLEADAQRVRQTLEKISEAELSAAAVQDGLPPDLMAHKANAERQLAEAVAALETIRLGLLRLTAGTGDVRSLTTDLHAASEIGNHINRLLEGMRDIDVYLRLSPVP